MPGKIRVGIRFCCPAVCSPNCYEENRYNLCGYFTMSELPEDKAKTFLAGVTTSEYCVYIKIETFCGKTVTIIHTLLKEICGNATMGKSTAQQWP